LSIEIGTKTNSVSWSVMELNFNPNFYKIEVDQARLNVRLIEGYFKHKLNWACGVTITNTCLSMRIQLEQKITVKPWQLSKTRLILSGQYYTVLKVSCKEALVDVIVLNTCRGGAAIEATGCPKYHAYGKILSVFLPNCQASIDLPVFPLVTAGIARGRGR